MTKDMLHSIVRLRYNLMATFNEGIAIETGGLTTICSTSDVPFNECINAVFITPRARMHSKGFTKAIGLSVVCCLRLLSVVCCLLSVSIKIG